MSVLTTSMSLQYYILCCVFLNIFLLCLSLYFLSVCFVIYSGLRSVFPPAFRLLEPKSTSLPLLRLWFPCKCFPILLQLFCCTILHTVVRSGKGELPQPWTSSVLKKMWSRTPGTRLSVHYQFESPESLTGIYTSGNCRLNFWSEYHLTVSMWLRLRF